MKTMTAKAMTVGSTVRYSRPQGDYERDCRFILLSDPNVVNAVSIQLICGERIKPIEIVAASEIEAVQPFFTMQTWSPSTGWLTIGVSRKGA